MGVAGEPHAAPIEQPRSLERKTRHGRTRAYESEHGRDGSESPDPFKINDPPLHKESLRRKSEGFEKENGIERSRFSIYGYTRHGGSIRQGFAESVSTGLSVWMRIWGRNLCGIILNLKSRRRRPRLFSHKAHVDL
jgi:hypothetical protein